MNSTSSHPRRSASARIALRCASNPARESLCSDVLHRRYPITLLMWAIYTIRSFRVNHWEAMFRYGVAIVRSTRTALGLKPEGWYLLPLNVLQEFQEIDGNPVPARAALQIVPVGTYRHVVV